MLPPWVIDEIRREEQRRRQKHENARRLPPPEPPRHAPRRAPVETEDGERDSNRVPVVVDIYGDDNPDAPGVGDVVIR